MYFILEITDNFPIYRQKQRIVTSVNRCRTNMGMETNNTFAIQIYATVQPTAMKLWIKNGINCLNPRNIHYKRFLRLRARLVTVPFESWNLRRVNIQKKLKEHTWNLNAVHLQRKEDVRQGLPAPRAFRPPPGFELSESTVPSCQVFKSSLVGPTPHIPSFFFFRVFGDSKTRRRPHLDDQVFKQTRCCANIGLKCQVSILILRLPLLSNPFPGLKVWGRNLVRAKTFCATSGSSKGWRILLLRSRTRTRVSFGSVRMTPLFGTGFPASFSSL